ncbi:MAG: serine hydrolase [Rhodoferax sp.]|nr:serine hydrolase [Rhodoferax sp.]
MTIPMPNLKTSKLWLTPAIYVMAAMALAATAPAQAQPRPAAAIDQTAKTDKALRIKTLVSQYHAIGQLNGAVLVADHGKVVYQGAFGLASHEWKIPNGTDTAFRIASLTKQFTATLVMQLVEQGKIRLDDKIGVYVPDLRADIGSQVTIHQLLNHTSGIVDYANFPGFWENRLGAKVTRAEFLEIMNRDLEFAPGSAGKYNSSGYYLLGYVIEKATGKSFQRALDDMILQPLHMERSGYESPARIVARKATGYVRAPGGAFESAAPMYMPNGYSAGGMFSTVGDLLRWDRALNGTKLLSESAKQSMFTPYVKDDIRGDLGYGYGWMIGNRKVGGRDVTVHEHGGNTNGFRSLITRFPQDQRLVVILLNDGGGTITPAIYKLSAAITSALYDLPTPAPQRALADTLAQAIARHGPDAAVANFQQSPGTFPAVDGANELNLLGYHYLTQDRLPEAIAVFQVNVELFPKDGNAYDSLGEAYMVQGDTTRAIANYRRALALEPTNSNAVEMLRRLEAK